MIGSYLGLPNVVDLLLEIPVDVDSRHTQYGQTPLPWAPENRQKAVVKVLLEKAANVDSRDDFNKTPLSWAAENGHEAVIRILLDRGADFESKNEDGRTPLSWAAWNGHE